MAFCLTFEYGQALSIFLRKFSNVFSLAWRLPSSSNLNVKAAKKGRKEESTEDLVRVFRTLPNSPFLEQFKGMEPRTMDDILDIAFEKMKLGKEETAEGEIAANWAKVVGRAFAGKCAPDRLTDDGVLMIHASGAAVRQELSFIKRQILSSIQKLPRCGHVRDLSLRVT